MTREERITKLVDFVREQEQKAEETLDCLREFTTLLYTELEKVILAAVEKGIGHSGNINRRDLPDGLKSFSFEWNGARIIISPVTIAAFPEPDLKTGGVKLAEELAGRIVIFHQPINDRAVGSPIGELYVLPNSEWRAFGVLGPVLGDSFDEHELGNFSLSLLENLIHNFKLYHRTRQDTKFDPNSQGVKDPLGFPIHEGRLSDG
jgi:hypothetical protein